MGGFCRVHSIKVPSKMSADDPAGALPLVCYSLPLADMSGEYMGRAEGTSQVGLSHDPWAVTLMRARGHPGPQRSFSPLKISADVAEFVALYSK